MNPSAALVTAWTSIVTMATAQEQAELSMLAKALAAVLAR
jgi:hypothetical protein